MQGGEGGRQTEKGGGQEEGDGGWEEVTHGRGGGDSAEFLSTSGRNNLSEAVTLTAAIPPSQSVSGTDDAFTRSHKKPQNENSWAAKIDCRASGGAELYEP